MKQRKFPIFAERFSKLRGEKTQDEFASFLGISRPTVGFYENGARLPDALILRQISEKCNVSADWLLGLSDENSNDYNIQATCKFTGLTEGAASTLQCLSGQEDKSMLIVLNYLIEDKDFLKKLTSYLAFCEKEIARSRPFLLIPYDKRNMDARLPFADVIESLPKLQTDFYTCIKNDSIAIEQMAFTIISKCVGDDAEQQLLQLLYDSRDDSDKDAQLSEIAKFLRFCDWADYMDRLGCNLEKFIIDDKEEVK